MNFKIFARKGQRGFTLVELMVVMAVIAVMAAVVVPAVTGTKQASQDSAVIQDANATQSAVSDFASKANLSELLTSATAVVAGPAAAGVQVTSNKWPEKTIVSAYTDFDDTNIVITIKDKNNATILAKDFVEDYNAIDFSDLEGDGGFAVPNSTDDLGAGSHLQYLWVLKKTAVGTDTDGGREVQVYSLTTVDDTSTTDTLTYVQLF